MTVKRFQQLAAPHLEALRDLTKQMRETGDTAEDSQQVAIRQAVHDVEKLFNGVTADDLLHNHENRRLMTVRRATDKRGPIFKVCDPAGLDSYTRVKGCVLCHLPEDEHIQMHGRTQCPQMSESYIDGARRIQHFTL